jgi:ABC-type Fe3+-hydroxamate transport system substrate-binding protein
MIIIKKSTINYLFTIILLLFLCCAGCIDSETEINQTDIPKISVFDSDGNILEFNSPPQRIAITGGNIAEVLIMIGAQKQIVGVGETIKSDPRLMNLNSGHFLGIM